MLGVYQLFSAAMLAVMVTGHQAVLRRFMLLQVVTGAFTQASNPRTP